MKNIYYLFWLSVILLSCERKSEFIVTGKLSNAIPDSKVYLVSYANDDATVIDSTVLINDGEFKFKQKAGGKNFYKLDMGNREFLFTAGQGDKIDITADLSNVDMNYQLSGCDEAVKLQEITIRKNLFYSRLANIEQHYKVQLAANKYDEKTITEQYHRAREKEDAELANFIIKFANENTDLLASYFAIIFLDSQKYERELISYSDKIKSNFIDNPSVTDFIVRMAKLKTVQVGQQAPKFTIQSLDNLPISLDNFKGQYVLLDFWASWCMPCRKENPNLVEAYNQFKSRNFTILGISLDKDKNEWGEAVAADNLLWHHGSELNDFNGKTVQMYQVSSLPSSFVIDPKGTIIAKNLQGKDLLKFLSNTLPSN